MKSVIYLLLVTVALVSCGPIDDGLLEPQRPRQMNPDDVDAVVLDVGDNQRQPPRRPLFGRPYFDQDEFTDDDDDTGFGNTWGTRPFGWSLGFRPYGDDFFNRLRRQMELFRHYMNSLFNGTSPFMPSHDLPPTYSNSTYTTKVVNGSVISVNETIKKHSTNDSSFVFRIKVINVRPQNETIPKGEEQQPKEPSFGVWPIPEQKPEATPADVPIETESTSVTPEDELSNDVNQGGLQFR